MKRLLLCLLLTGCNTIPEGRQVDMEYASVRWVMKKSLTSMDNDGPLFPSARYIDARETLRSGVVAMDTPDYSDSWAEWCRRPIPQGAK